DCRVAIADVRRPSLYRGWRILRNPGMTRRKSSTHAGRRSSARELVDAVGGLLVQARSALFITGPALSADSGPTHHRGIAGLVRKKPEDAKLIEASLSPETLGRKPATTWSYLLKMDELVRAARPNAGHEVLVKIERDLPRTTTMTINVDRLHQRAG